MLKRVILLMVLVTSCLYAIPHGRVVEGLKMTSEIVDYDVNYSVYLPPDYEYSNRFYPIVYLLHGYTDDNTAWVQFGEVNMAADQAIANREIPAMIIVMPDAKVTFYINDYQAKDRYEDMFIQEFIPFVESQYRVRSQKTYRGVSGLSMGGYGSLIYALHHPDLFAVCAPFSAGINTDEERINMETEKFKKMYQPLYGGTDTGKGRLTEHYRKNSVLDLVANMPESELKSVRYYIDCGDDDFLIRGNCELHLLLKDREIPHEFRVRDGVHNWTYWRTGIIDALAFIGNSFKK